MIVVKITTTLVLWSTILMEVFSVVACRLGRYKHNRRVCAAFPNE